MKRINRREWRLRSFYVRESEKIDDGGSAGSSGGLEEKSASVPLRIIAGVWNEKRIIVCKIKIH